MRRLALKAPAPSGLARQKHDFRASAAPCLGTGGFGGERALRRKLLEIWRFRVQPIDFVTLLRSKTLYMPARKG
jgi:hypothetical protein